jgi:uncharacterized lipoprotein YmbA
MNKAITAIARVFALALPLSLAACGSSPHNHYYLLTAADVHSASGQTPSLGIGPVEIPEYLNRSGLVYSRQGNQLQISSQERWAEPLESGITRVLGLNLANLLNTENLRYFPWNPQRAPDYGVKITLLSLDANDRQATLVAEWLVYRPASSETVNRRISQLHRQLPPGELDPAQLAPTYSMLLQELSEIIAAAISAAEAAPAPPPLEPQSTLHQKE